MVKQNAAGTLPAQAADLAANAKSSYSAMMQTSLYGPDWLLRKALKDAVAGRNWRRLAAKLATPGSNITVVTFGGSSSTGYGLQERRANWVSQFCSWLQSAFMHTNIMQVWEYCCSCASGACVAYPSNAYCYSVLARLYCMVFSM
jgi:hypothetical protein